MSYNMSYDMSYPEHLVLHNMQGVVANTFALALYLFFEPGKASHRVIIQTRIVIGTYLTKVSLN